MEYEVFSLVVDVGGLEAEEEAEPVEEVVVRLPRDEGWFAEVSDGA